MGSGTGHGRLVRRNRSRGATLAKCHVPALVVAALVATLAACAPGVRDSSPVVRSAPGAKEVVVVESDAAEKNASELRAVTSEIAQLRKELNTASARADAAAERSAAASRQSQLAIQALQTELANVRTRADAAAAQADQAYQLATEFLTNLVATRDEQRTQVERNMKNFDGVEQRLRAIELGIAETDKQYRAQTGASLEKSRMLEQRVLKTDQQVVQLREQSAQAQQQSAQLENDLAQLRVQLAEVNRLQTETLTQLDSGPMLRMLRDLESTQRDTAVLRGALEELQREQEEGRKRVQNYYLDLDARIQALQDSERKRRAAETRSEVETGAVGAGPAPMTNELPVISTEPANAADEISPRRKEGDATTDGG